MGGISRRGQLGGQIVRMFLRGERVVRQAQQFLIGAQREIGVGDFGYKAQLRGDTGFVQGEVRSQGLVAQAADTAPEVQLPGGRHAGNIVSPADVGGLRGAEFGRNALGGAARGKAQIRQHFGALNAVQRLRRFDVERGPAQVPVVVQRDCDQLLQQRIAEKIPPADVCGGGLVRLFRRVPGVCGIRRVGRVDGRRGALVPGSQGAAGQCGREGQRRQRSGQSGTGESGLHGECPPGRQACWLPERARVRRASRRRASRRTTT